MFAPWIPPPARVEAGRRSRPRAAIADALRAVAAARAALVIGDGATALVMIQAARAQLGELAEHFGGAELAGERARLASASFELADAAEAVRRADPGADARLGVWLKAASAWRAVLLKAEPRSLYDAGRLAAALGMGARASRQASRPRPEPLAGAAGGR